MIPCRICGTCSGLVKSHIIPEAFFRQLRVGGRAPLLVADAKAHLPKRAPIGIYDNSILCKTCEARFLPFDTYGIDVLLTRFDDFFGPVVSADKTIAFESSSVAPMRILEFLVAILWRGSVSTQPFFSSLILGPHEESAKSGLFAFGPSVPVVFDAVLSRWANEDAAGFPATPLLNPHPERWSGVNAYRLYLGKVIAYIKVDSRPFPLPLSRFSLRNGLPCRIISRTLAGSKDIMAMERTAMTAERNRQGFLVSHGAAE
jgi:hypothetical protein